LWSENTAKIKTPACGKSLKRVFLLSLSHRAVSAAQLSRALFAIAFDIETLRRAPATVQGYSRRAFTYIFSGAETPMRDRQDLITMRTQSASFSRAAATSSASPLMRQAL